jgi:hypothetical protein
VDGQTVFNDLLQANKKDRNNALIEKLAGKSVIDSVQLLDVSQGNTSSYTIQQDEEDEAESF